MRRVVLDIRRNALLFDARTIRGKHRWEAVALAGFIDAAGAPVRVQALQTWLTAAGQHSPLDRTGISRLLHAAGLIQVPPAQCCYLGDDLRDIQAARAAGMFSVAVEYGYGGSGPNGPRSWNAEAVIATPLDLLPHLPPV